VHAGVCSACGKSGESAGRGLGTAWLGHEQSLGRSARGRLGLKKNRCLFGSGFLIRTVSLLKLFKIDIFPIQFPEQRCAKFYFLVEIE
jgi:hypothetical protein